ncbi:MAG: hypothetical protein FJ279_10840, partial [Planctomycetes bacterium]|nr:hypothetical protein [Planctomycetota bacterium]
MNIRYSVVALFVLCACAFGQGAGILQNGGFEEVSQVTPGADGLVSGWKLGLPAPQASRQAGAPPSVPKGWALNAAYPGQLA